MNQTLTALAGFSGIAFLSYGLLCVFSGHMRAEFERYGLSAFRRWVGALEVCGGLGVLVGLRWPPLLIFSASGLTILMALGLAVRARLKDSGLQMAPAAVLLLINAMIVWASLKISQ